MFKLLKKAFIWYCNQCAQTYACTPTCTIPYVKPKTK